MSEFEFVFSLFGLLLGLALAEGLGGLSKALKASHKVRIGWLTALTGLFVSCDAVTFWMYAWGMREVLPFGWPTVFLGFVVTAIFYVSASLIFPDDPEDWTDLDDHFFKHRRKVLGGVALCNAALLGAALSLGAMREPFSIRTLVIAWSFFPLIALAIMSSRRAVIIAALITLIALYPLSVVWR